ncbi:CDP-glycerol glycerophosphotransferase family protein [Psychrobacter sp.]|uniref:CDP-glycerol glycerophosphotransferase family protein n=1 Tax=Psychrobacter sp. TaxID=56811 RepID=UPI003565EB7F
MNESLKILNKVGNKLITQLPVNEKQKHKFARRLNKLSRDPIGFMEGSYNKRLPQLKSLIPIKYIGNNNFAVIVPVYNVEKYIDEYFRSLVSQTLSFKKHIRLIIVDDGSTDSSSAIVQKWMRKYPDNIFYFYKENGGLSSARNYGLNYLYENELAVDYISFIDPDDFLSVDYFKSVDDFFSNHPKCKIASCNLKYFFEEDNKVRDIHPLKFRYNKTKALKSLDLGNNILLSAATAFYDLKLLKSLGITFDENVKPSFEDCKFNNQILSLVPQIEVGFIKEAVYFYRQRADSSSLMNNSWKNKGLFLNTLEYGVLDLLISTQKNMGYVPKYIQNVALFHCTGYYRRLINAENNANLLSSTELDKFTRLLEEIFTYIDEETIFSCKFSNLQTKIKIGMLGFYKKQRYPISYFYTNRIDIDNQVIDLSFFSHYTDDCIDFKFNDVSVYPLEQKIVSSLFLGNNFYYERRILLKYVEVSDVLEISVNGKLVNLTCFTKSLTGGDIVSNLIRYMENRVVYKNIKDSWVIMDRIDKADDNAEHFYRFLKVNYPQLEIFFAISKDSEDWTRLSEEGFTLLDYGSSKFSQELRSCKYIVSSHLFIWNYFIDQGRETLSQKKNIWLQHGVIANNNSNVVNTKLLDLMVTSIEGEYHSISDNGSEYNLLPSQVVLSGLPRHDNLIKISKEYKSENLVFIMPTWRTWLKNEEIIESEYFEKWIDFLNDVEVERILSDTNYKIVFVMHEELKEFIGFFPKKTYITYEESGNKSLQELFVSSKLIITDYSSVSFDMAYINKPVIYFQFDRDRFFAEHYRKGYFSYEQDGFGPVVTSHQELVNNLTILLKNDSKPLEPYITRMEKTFLFKDGDNCKRVYEAIVKTNDCKEESFNLDIVTEYASQAYISEDWNLAKSRASLILECGDISQQNLACNIWLRALLIQNEYSEIESFLFDRELLTTDLGKFWQAKIAFAVSNWNKTVKILEQNTFPDLEVLFMQLSSYSELGDSISFSKIKDRILNFDLTETQSLMLDVWQLQAIKDWENLIELLQSKLYSFDSKDLINYKPQILLAQAYRRTYNYEMAHQQLTYFEKHTTSDSRCSNETARLAYARENYDKCVIQYNKSVNNDTNLLAEEYVIEFMQSLFNINRFKELNHSLGEYLNKYPNQKYLDSLYVMSLAQNSNWREVVDSVTKFNLLSNNEMIYPVTLARYRLGFIDEAYDDSVKPTNKHSYEYWSLIAEIAELVEDFELAKYCYKGMIAIFPDKDYQDHWSKLESIRGYT